MNIRLETTLMAALLAGTAVAQAPTLVADINNAILGFDSRVDGGRTGYIDEKDEDSFALVNGFWYFTATTGASGDELWRTDGTAAGTSMVMDINPGTASSSPGNLVSFFGAGLFFTANDGTNGTELWYTDGITTSMLADINPGSSSSSPNELKLFGVTLFFSANDGTNGTEVWTSDTTAAGTNLFMDIRVGSSSSSPTEFAPLPGGATMVFRANDGGTGSELWSTDGTPAGTSLLVDIRPSGSGLSSSSRFIPLGADLVFEANDGTNGEELWKTDGTALGTTLIKDINGTSSSSSIDLEHATEFNGFLYFRANEGSGTELFRTDGTLAGTTMHWDANISSATSSSFPAKFRLFNGELFFRADVDDGITDYGAYELCKVDALGVPSVVVDFAPGSLGGLASGADLFVWNGQLFFTGNTGASGTELCVTDGTAVGTMLLLDIEPGTGGSGPDWFTPISPTQMMFVADTFAQGEELWVTDGTAAGTMLLAEADASVNSPDSDPAGLVSHNGKDLFFSARIPGGTSNEELCKWEPGIGVTIIKDINPGTTGSVIDEGDWTYARLGGQDVLVFQANDGTNGSELWISDGTNAGTNLITDLNPGTGGQPGDKLVYWNGLVYFEGDDGVNGDELWVTDGTAAGTTMLKDINPGAPNSGIRMLATVYNNELYFRADDGVNGSELWKTDGTTAGTIMVADINPVLGESGAPQYPVIFNGLLLFQANDGVNGVEPWRTDGTAAGTVMIADINPGAGGSNWNNSPDGNGAAELNGWLYFRASGVDGAGSAVGFELFRTDLITTELVIDLRAGSSSGSPLNLTVFGNNLYFRGNDGFTGNELWVSDGTAVGTLMVSDNNPGTGSGYSATTSATTVDFINIGSGIYFRGSNGSDGTELWFSDGTAGGTVQVADLLPGSGSGVGGGYFAVASGQLFMRGNEGPLGDELYTVALPGATVQSIGHSGDGTRLTATTPRLGQMWNYQFAGAPAFGSTMSDGDTSIGSVRVWGSAIDDSFAGLGVTDAFSSFWFDLALAPVVIEYSPAASGSGGFMIPNNPALNGLRTNVQSVTLRSGILPYGTSNAVSMFLGN